MVAVEKMRARDGDRVGRTLPTSHLTRLCRRGKSVSIQTAGANAWCRAVNGSLHLHVPSLLRDGCCVGCSYVSGECSAERHAIHAIPCAPTNMSSRVAAANLHSSSLLTNSTRSTNNNNTYPTWRALLVAHPNAPSRLDHGTNLRAATACRYCAVEPERTKRFTAGGWWTKTR